MGYRVAGMEAEASGTGAVRVVGEQAGRTGVTRLLLLCAVMLGIFLMHGAPSAATGGCHEAAGGSVLLTGHHPAAMTAVPDPPAPSGSAAHPVSASQPDGSLCVSTAARERGRLPVAGLLALVLFFVAGRVAGFGPAGAPLRGRRGPPRYGRELLLQVCIART